MSVLPNEAEWVSLALRRVAVLLTLLFRKHDKKKCKKCDAIRMGLFDVDPAKLRTPKVTNEHFYQALGKPSLTMLSICLTLVITANSRGTVSPSELTQFEAWTQEFGQEG